MGQSSSRSRRRNDDRQYYTQHAPLPPPPSPPPQPSTPPYNLSSRPNFSTPYYNSPPAAAAPYYDAYQPQPSRNYNGLTRLFESWMNYSFPSYYRSNQGNVWWNSAAPPPPGTMPPYSSFSTASSSSTVVTPPPYVEHQKAKTIKNDINLHKDMIRLEVDVQNPEEYLVSFVYDAVVDGRSYRSICWTNTARVYFPPVVICVTIYYFAKEGTNCSFSSIEEDIYKPRSYPFEKGTAQRFCQPSGHGIDLGFFDLDSLSKPLNGDVFPLVIYAKACGPTLTDGQSVQSVATHVQITLAIIEKNNKGAFDVKVIKQILWIDGERYELQEIFGLADSSSEPIDDGDDDIGKECVICLTEPRNTAVFPCRHLCMCSDCAKSLRVQSNKCPICRQPVEKLMEINVNVRSSDG